MTSKSNNRIVNYLICIVFFSFIQLVFINDAYSQKQIDPAYINQFKRLISVENKEQLLHRNNDGLARCATELVHQRKYGKAANNMRSLLKDFGKNSRFRSSRVTEILEIPLIFHVIHNGQPVGTSANIDGIYIAEQIKQANDDFRKIAGSSGDGDGVDTKIQFVPATVDPFGNVLDEPGINRIDIGFLNLVPPYSIENLEEIIKPQTIWNPNLYVNTWTADLSDGILGYAQYPEAANLIGIGQDSITDGIVVRFKSIGSTQLNYPSGDPFNAGRTWTHEAGHYLGLVHIWGDGDCSVDDFCDDTPNAASPSFGCPTVDTCPSDPGNDQVENYMDYTDDSCMNIFSSCQSDRMRRFLGVTGTESIRRSSLVTSPVGVTDGFALIMNDTKESACITDDATFDFSMTYVGGFSEEVKLSFVNLPPGIRSTFSNDTIFDSGKYDINLSNLELLVPDGYQFKMAATDMSGNSFIQTISLDVDFTISESPGLVSPLNQSNPTSLPITFNWTPINYAKVYEIQIATDPAFSDVMEMSVIDDISYQSNQLMENSLYYWKVRGRSACNQGAWSEVFSLTTGDVIPCTEYDVGPFIDFNQVDCFPKCENEISLPEEVWAGESYIINGLTEGAEYIFEFCDQYDPAAWPATITVTDIESNIIAATNGCSITFESSVTGSILVIISDTCGEDVNQIDNGIPTFRCTSNGSALPKECRSCLVSEDFESGLPVGWSTEVTGGGDKPQWVIDDHPFAFFVFSGYLAENPGLGNWMYYDDDANGFVSANNVATVRTPFYNLEGVNGLELNFDYAYVDQGFTSKMFLSITDGNQELFFDGINWQGSKTVWLDSDSQGSFSEKIPASLDSKNISVSLSYDDDFQWAWGFGFDNFSICGDCAVFNDMGVICQNSVPPDLPSSSANGISGIWNPSVINTSKVGVSTYRFTPTAQSLCDDINLNIKISAKDDASFLYVDTAFCNGMADPVPIITGLEGGIFSSTAGIIIDGVTGKIDLIASQAGMYTIEYVSSGSCKSVQAQTVEILPVFECPVILPKNLITTKSVLTFGDPCQCDNVKNCNLGSDGPYYIQDSLRIPAVGQLTSGLDIRIEAATDFYINLDCSLGSIELPQFGIINGTHIPEVSPGVYMLEFWQTSSAMTSLSIISGNGMSVDAPSELFIEQCNCILPIPTMGEWALYILTLLLLIVSVLNIKESYKKASASSKIS